MTISEYFPELIEMVAKVELESPSQVETIIRVAETHFEREDETHIQSQLFSSCNLEDVEL